MGRKRGSQDVAVIKRLQQTCPLLNSNNCRKKSKADSKYNCAAFAGGDTRQWWQPLYHWHPKAVRSTHYASLESQYYHESGYVRCADGTIEPGFEKIAIYANDVDDWTHAAHQRQDGWWESKIGIDVDIWHTTTECLEGGEYGTVKIFLKRPVPASTTP